MCSIDILSMVKYHFYLGDDSFCNNVCVVLYKQANLPSLTIYLPNNYLKHINIVLCSIPQTIKILFGPRWKIREASFCIYYIILYTTRIPMHKWFANIEFLHSSYLRIVVRTHYGSRLNVVNIDITGRVPTHIILYTPIETCAFGCLLGV